MRLRGLARVPLVLVALVTMLVSSTPALASTPEYALTRTVSHVVIRWNPCVAIHYRMDLAHAPKGAMRDVKAAVARLARATGMDFVYDGQTSVIPQASFGENAPTGQWPPLTIAWAAPGNGKGRSDALKPTDAGVGGVYYTEWFSPDGSFHPLQVVTGLVVINDTYNRFYRPGFGSGFTRGSVLLHELGHAVGLLHVRDRSQIMFPDAIARAKAQYGSGDLAGLRRVGRWAGCITPLPASG